MVFINEEKRIRAFAVFVVTMMALSMVALILYVPPNPTNEDTPPEPIVSRYNYTLSFDSNVVRDIWIIKAFAFTDVFDKDAIDNHVLDINGVLKVSSQFKKESIDSVDWLYVAEIVVNRGSNIRRIVNDFLDINFFNKEKRDESGALKQMTIVAPKNLMIHNVDLNIDRNFSFETDSLPVWVNTDTSIGDELAVQGNMVMQNKDIIELLLVEVRNITTDRIIEQLMQQVQDQNKSFDSNAPSPDLNLNDLNK